MDDRKIRQELFNLNRFSAKGKKLQLLNLKPFPNHVKQERNSVCNGVVT